MRKPVLLPYVYYISLIILNVCIVCNNVFIYVVKCRWVLIEFLLVEKHTGYRLQQPTYEGKFSYY